MHMRLPHVPSDAATMYLLSVSAHAHEYACTHRPADSNLKAYHDVIEQKGITLPGIFQTITQ